jgi:hypothetical protein
MFFKNRTKRQKNEYKIEMLIEETFAEIKKKFHGKR